MAVSALQVLAVRASADCAEVCSAGGLLQKPRKEVMPLRSKELGFNSFVQLDFRRNMRQSPYQLNDMGCEASTRAGDPV